jgi:hypothetical protein
MVQITAKDLVQLIAGADIHEGSGIGKEQGT